VNVGTFIEELETFGNKVIATKSIIKIIL